MWTCCSKKQIIGYLDRLEHFLQSKIIKAGQMIQNTVAVCERLAAGSETELTVL